MAATKAPKERAPHRHWPMAEKRRIVELTLRPGASFVAVAREHGVNPNSLYRWRRLYRAGKLDPPVKSTARLCWPGRERDVCAGERGSRSEQASAGYAL